MRALLLLLPFLILSFLHAAPAPVDEEGARVAFVVAAHAGAFLFKMVPGPDGAGGHGEAFSVQADGGLKPLWKVDGWYGRQIYISDDGRNLVRVEPRHAGRTVSKTDLAVAFYHDGALAREYHTADLVKRPGLMKPGPGSYDWLAPAWVVLTDSRKPDGTFKVERDPEAEPVLDAAGLFRLKTVDRIVYHFEAATGRLVRRQVRE